eukprot:956955-Lingulodinium_polyedra.AAC.1
MGEQRRVHARRLLLQQKVRRGELSVGRVSADDDERFGRRIPGGGPRVAARGGDGPEAGGEETGRLGPLGARRVAAQRGLPRRQRRGDQR